MSQIDTFATREKMPFFPVTARVFGTFDMKVITPVVQGGGFDRFALKKGYLLRKFAALLAPIGRDDVLAASMMKKDACGIERVCDYNANKKADKEKSRCQSTAFSFAYFIGVGGVS